MKRMWIKISLADAKNIIDQAYTHNFPKEGEIQGDCPFPKTIQGIRYKSAGDFIYSMLSPEQKLTIKKSKWELEN